MRYSLLAVLLFAACARTPERVTPRPTPSANVETADFVTFFNSTDDFERSRWYRVGDLQVGFFVVSLSGSICLTQDGTWVTARHGDLFRCAGGWRPQANGFGASGARVPGGK